MTRRISKEIRNCECLDFVEAAHRHRVYPLMYCHMELSGRLDINGLKQAVSRSSEIVPEILYAYDFRKGCFVDLGYTADNVVLVNAADASMLRQPDLSRQPQLQIILTRWPECNQAVIVMSHILADAKGFLQYLYLLAALYNGEQVDMNIKNTRSIGLFLKEIRILAATQQTKQNRHLSVPPLRAYKKAGRSFCIKTQVAAESMAAVRRRAGEYGAALNDVFMAAYARVIARLQGLEAVVLPCPADLRCFFPELQGLSVANMTGIYRKIAVEVKQGSSFASTMQQINIEMTLQKSRYRCFSGIKALYRGFGRVQPSMLERVIRAAYRLHPVSYTNIGVIDDTRLNFKDCTLRDCFLTGAYRLPPDFQLTVSTFRNVCTLNCALLGSSEDAEKGQYILEQVKQEILDWIERN